ncbi:MAG: ABC transporter ATP-binding protein [Gammaproteobacteria bacterium]|jgi:putrescine transport system ATP-binding protein
MQGVTTSGRTPEQKAADRPWDEPGARPFIELRGVGKRFGDFVAVDSVDLSIYQGELFSILGASGCGKTTLLRMMAGFEAPSTGRVIIDGTDVTGLPPYRRPVNMMFQSYALFPHMNVHENIAYGLKKERLPAAEIRERVTDMLGLVKLGDFADRRPEQLSGGQRQRVALARALVKRPKVLLLDEPLAALDRKLREHTQFELANLQDELGITFVVVTHDQEEAMMLSTRIAVMEAGRLCQVDTPKRVYEYPRSRFVADFIGNINIFEGRVVAVRDGRALIESADTGTTLAAETSDPPQVGTDASVAIRPEKIFIDKEAPAGERQALRGVVWDFGYFGNLSLYQVRLPGGKVVLVSAQNRQRSAERPIDWEDEVYLSWDTASAILLRE